MKGICLDLVTRHLLSKEEWGSGVFVRIPLATSAALLLGNLSRPNMQRNGI